MRADFPANWRKWDYFLTYERQIEEAAVRKRYRQWLERWGIWLTAQELTWAEATAYEAAEYIALLESPDNPYYKKAYARATVSHAISCIRLAYDFLVREGVVGSNPFALIRKKSPRQTLPVCLTREEVNKLLAVADHGTVRGARDGAMCELLYATGLRAAELCGLDLGDVDWDSGEIRVRKGKGSKQRIVIAYPSALNSVRYWANIWRREYRQTPKEQAVFLGEMGDRIARQQVYSAVQRATERAGLRKNVTPHTLRHTFATHLVEGGAPIEAVQELLGHSSIRSTQIYLHLSREHVKSHYLKAHPLAPAQGKRDTG